jgi:hypothetical protein
MYKTWPFGERWLVVLDYEDGNLPLDLGMRVFETWDEAHIEARLLNVYHGTY